jgi:hypothetical protein
MLAANVGVLCTEGFISDLISGGKSLIQLSQSMSKVEVKSSLISLSHAAFLF